MLIKTVGRPAHVRMQTIKKATEFYGKYLISSTKLYNNIDLTIIFEKFAKDDNDYGYCDWIDDNHCSREFTITLDRTLNKKETLLALAHEMVHLKQYAKGELKDIFRPVRMVKWHGDRYLHEQIDYWEQPWEIEAYGREKGLYFKFMYYMKNGEKDIPCLRSKHIKIM